MKFLLVILAAACIWIGAQGLLSAVSFGTPAEYTIEEFISKRPGEEKVTLTGVQMDISLAIYASSGKSKNYYVAARPAEWTAKEQIHLLIAVQDPEILKVIHELEEIEVELQDEFMLENSDRVFVEKSITGRLRGHGGLDEDVENNLRKFETNLAQDFFVLEEKGRPNWFRIACLPAGLGILGFLFFARSAEGEEEDDDEEPLEELDL